MRSLLFVQLGVRGDPRCGAEIQQVAEASLSETQRNHRQYTSVLGHSILQSPTGESDFFGHSAFSLFTL